MAIVTLGVSLTTIAAPSTGALISDWAGIAHRHVADAGLARIGTTETLPAGGFLFCWSAVGHHQRNKMENTGKRVSGLNARQNSPFDR